MDTVALFNQMLLAGAIPILTGAVVTVGRQVWKWLKSKITVNQLAVLTQVVQTVADAARKSGLLTQASAAEKAVETALVADAQAFCDAHGIPIGSVAALTALVRAELLKDIQGGTALTPGPSPKGEGSGAAPDKAKG